MVRNWSKLEFPTKGRKSTRVNRSQHHQGSEIKPSLIMCGSALRKKRRKKN
ncbi:hypothetical protein RchiOBHm_Chr5g0052911 [Rosa chinensis]|uniref:Uncharacterized protein n=1 Tax=Rosa chinensis TaxID=74649 RepID=A0A2P6QFR4_ROSCH|nr:hypothetical protein RchiOBHm_Chr5g0052911 [Rosa chinensis]